MAKFWEYSLKTIFGNTAARIMLVLYLFGLVAGIIFTFCLYKNEMKGAINQEFARLESISSTVAHSIDADVHSTLFSEHKLKDEIASNGQNEQYRKIHELLAAIKRSNKLESDIYTLTQEDGRFYFGVSSSEQPYFRHEWTHPHAEHSSDYARGGKVGPYEDENGIWLSSFSPIKDMHGRVVCLIQADTCFDRFQANVYESTWKKIFVQLGIFFFISILLIFFLKKVLKQDEDMKLKMLDQSMELEARNKDFMDSLRAAKRVQEAFIPSADAIQKDLESFIKLYLPKDVVSGDFLWHKKIGSKIFIAVGDCTGHGIPGALMSMIGSAALDFAALAENATPAKILNRLEKIIKNNFNKRESAFEAMDIAICSYDESDGTLYYAGAMRPLLHISDHGVQKIKGDKRSIGSNTDERFTDNAVAVRPGDRVYMYSDGYHDQFGGVKGKKYMSKKFEKFISSIQSHDMKDQQALLAYEFHLWSQDEFQVDDVLVAGFEIPSHGASMKVA